MKRASVGAWEGIQNITNHNDGLQVCCPTVDCLAQGKIGTGNQVGHGKKRAVFTGTCFADTASDPAAVRRTFCQVVTFGSQGSRGHANTAQ